MLTITEQNNKWLNRKALIVWSKLKIFLNKILIPRHRGDLMTVSDSYYKWMSCVENKNSELKGDRSTRTHLLILWPSRFIPHTQTDGSAVTRTYCYSSQCAIHHHHFSSSSKEASYRCCSYSGTPSAKTFIFICLHLWMETDETEENSGRKKW